MFLAGDAVEYSTIKVASSNPKDDVDEATPLQIAPDDTEVADYEEDAADDKDDLQHSEEQEPNDNEKKLTAQQELAGLFSTKPINFITSVIQNKNLSTISDRVHEAF